MLKEHSGAQFAGRREYKQFLNPANEGLLLDGDNLRLSERESFQNVCVIARVGAGKTSQYIIPNVLDKAERNCSLVINDPKGEVYEQTSQYMKDKGFEILVIDPENLGPFQPFQSSVGGQKRHRAGADRANPHQCRKSWITRSVLE